MTWKTTLTITDDALTDEEMLDPRDGDRASDAIVEIRVNQPEQRINVVAKHGFEPSDTGFADLVDFMGSIAEMASASLTPRPQDLAAQMLVAKGMSHEEAVKTIEDIQGLISNETEAATVTALKPVEEPRWEPTAWQKEQMAELINDQGMSREGAEAYVRQIARKNDRELAAEAAARAAHPSAHKRAMDAANPFRAEEARPKRFNPKPTGKGRGE